MGIATPEVAEAVSSRLVPGGSRARPGAMAPPPPRLKEEEEKEIKERQERTIELLRFFYSCFPLQPATAPRAANVREAISKFLTKDMYTMRDALPRDNPSVSIPVLAKIRPLILLLEHGLRRYDAEKAKC